MQVWCSKCRSTAGGPKSSGCPSVATRIVMGSTRAQLVAGRLHVLWLA